MSDVGFAETVFDAAEVRERGSQKNAAECGPYAPDLPHILTKKRLWITAISFCHST